MKPKRLKHADTIGIISPSHVADIDIYEQYTATIKRLGFNVKTGSNIYKDTYGYAASAAERADDLNDMVSDSDVNMILFGGGESSVELLPYVDYENIRKNPKIFSSYSDGTTILNTIYSQTGLTTYYGFGAGEFYDLRQYNYEQFCAQFVEGYEAKRFMHGSEPVTVCGGSCEGVLIGGYPSLFGLLLSGRYFQYDKNTKYLLFLEDHERFSEIGAVASYLAFIGQSGFMQNVTGLIFGQFAQNQPDSFLPCLERFGKKYGIPVMQTDDFGHGAHHAILPIGEKAMLDADKKELLFL